MNDRHPDELIAHLHDQIVRRLTDQENGRPIERLDWDGLGSVLRLFDSSSGRTREAMICALGRILENAHQPPWLLAQVLHLVASLDLAQLESSVEQLAASTLAADEPIRSALATNVAYRRVATHSPLQASAAP